MIKCVFTKSKEFKGLEEASGLSPASLEYVIYKYQNLNNTDNFPSLEYVKSMADPNIKSNINELENKASNITSALDSFNVNIAYFNNNDRSKEETIKIENSVRSFVAKSLQNFNLNVEYVNDSNDNFKTRLSGDTLFINLSSIHNETDLDNLIQGIKLKYPKKFNKDLDSKILEVTELLETGYPIILQNERTKNNFNKSGPIILKEGDNFDVIHTDELPEAILFKYKGVTYLFYDEDHLNDTIGSYKSLKDAIDNNVEGLSIVTQEGSLGNILNNIPAGTSQLLNTEDVLGNSLSDINLSAINTLLHKMEGKTDEMLEREYEGREDLLTALKGLKTALTNEQQLVKDNTVYNQEIATKKDGDTYFFSPKPFKAKDGSLFKTKEEVALYERKQRKNKTPITFEQKKQLFRRYLNILESGSIHFTNPTGLANHRILNTVFEDFDPANAKDRVIDLYSFATENLPTTNEAVKSYESVLENISERIEETAEGIKVLKKDRTSLIKERNKKQKEIDDLYDTLGIQTAINYEVNLGAEAVGVESDITINSIIQSIPEIIEVEYTSDFPPGTGGEFRKGGNIPNGKGKILINNTLSKLQQEESLAHEVVHGILKLRYEEKLDPNPKIEHRKVGSKYEHFYATYSSYGVRLGKRFDTKEEAESYIKNAQAQTVNFTGSALEKELKSIWKTIPKKGLNPILIDYINKDIEELITYSLTNKEFARFLNDIQYEGEIENYKGKSVFQVIIDLFSKILPVKGSAYEKVLSVLDKYSDNINIETQTTSQQEADIERRSGEPIKDFINRLFENNYLAEVDGKQLFNLTQGRWGVVVNINGVKVPFYQSTSGTETKTAGQWYPFFGDQGNWVIKGNSDDSNVGYGFKAIQDVQSFLNKNIKEKDAISASGLINSEVLQNQSSLRRLGEDKIKGNEKISLNREATAKRLSELMGYTLEEGRKTKSDAELFALASKKVFSELAALEGTTTAPQQVNLGAEEGGELNYMPEVNLSEPLTEVTDLYGNTLIINTDMLETSESEVGDIHWVKGTTGDLITVKNPKEVESLDTLEQELEDLNKQVEELDSEIDNNQSNLDKLNNLKKDSETKLNNVPKEFKSSIEDLLINRYVERIHKDLAVKNKYDKELESTYTGTTGRTFNRKSETHDTTDRKIALMQKMFGVRFEKDYGMTQRGALLNSNHPLTKKYGVPVIVINPDILLSDTVFHEIGHLYIELLGGLNDRMVQQAIRALKTSDFYMEIAEKYPELEGDNLDKEVLATALGMEADRLFDNNLTNLTWWQRFIRTLKDKLHAWFGIKTGKDSDVLLDLAREMLSDTSRIPAGAVYQSGINFYSKYEIPTSKLDKDGKAIPVDKQQEAIKLFEKLREDIKTDFEDGKHDYMKDGDLVTSTSISTTATRIAKTNQVSKIANNKGDYTIPFDRDDYNKDNIHVELARPVISNSLAKALDDFLHGEIDDAPKDFILKENVKNWVDQYIKEVVEMTTSESDEVLNMMMDNAGESVTSFRQAIEDNLDSILDRAEEYSKGSKQAPIVGNSLHKAMEDALEVIKNGGIPSLPRHINDKTGGKFLNEFTKIIKRGLSEGSVFFTEQVLWDNNTSRPGTADLIEITKDGEFRVYDFKTTYSFKNKKGTPKNNYQLYVFPGYLHQVLSYSNILENYGLTPAKDAYNIIMLETKYSNVVNESSPFTINDFKIQSLEKAGLGQSFTKASQQVDRHFKPRADLDQINNRSEIETIEDAAVKLKDTILLWKRELNKKMRGTTLAHFDKYYKEVSKLLGSDFVKDHNKFSKSQNITIISSFIDNVMKQIRVLEDTDVNNPDSEYLMSLNYVLQIGETLHKIKEIVNDRSLLEAEGMSVEGAVKLTEDLNSTIGYINTTRNFYKTKLKEQAINLLAENSNLAEGRIKELLEFEARKKGITDKDARKKYVFDNLARKKAEAKKTEITYWTAQFDNGILDIRSIERFMMDPGAISSQFIQVVKGMMDGTDMSIRREMLDLAPEVNEFYEQVKQRNPSGGTINQWGRFVNKSKQYIPQLDKEVEMLDGTLIPEFISDFYTDRVEFLRLRDNLMYKKKSILDKYQNKAIPEKAKEDLEKVNEKLAGLQKAYNKLVAKQRKNKNYKEARVNPEFSKLSKEDQEALRFMHNKLKASDMFIDDGKLKLTKDLGNDVFIYNLPKQRMSQLEAITNGKAGGQFISSIRDMVRPPADDTEYNVSEEEFNDGRDSKDNGDITSSRTDLDGNLIFDIPLWYRNNLEDPRLQSYDLPTLIVENHQTSLNYKQGLDIESDLFVILESLNSENDANVVRTDGFVSGKLKDASGKLFQKSTNNNIYNALKSSIDNRIYKRPYVGTFTKRNYQMIKAVEKVVQYSSLNALSLNFKSAFATSGQGAIYRFVEGMVGEHFTTRDWQAGNTKTFADLPNMILDSQKHVPTSKTNLLLRHFGLEQQAEALVNKFVQDNFVTKNLDSNSLYIITSMAETVVTSMLMYSKLNNIKVMNANQEYIDAEGNVVTKDKAMSLDEAYTVSDSGKLELNRNVVYTNHSLLNKYNEKGNDTGIAATEISRYMQGLYADLYGQYNNHLKSEFQRTVIGRMVMSMKGWFPRGVHRRFRNLTTALTSFEEMREDRNLYKRFYSQDLKQFQEGYYTSLVRYVASTIKGHKIASIGLIGSGKDVWNTMSEHERANLKRSLIELAVMSSLTALTMLLVEIARNMGDDDEDKEKVYAAAYFAWRINDELTTFINPKTLINMVRNPAAAFNTFDSLWKVLNRFISFSYEDGEFDWLIDERYERGSKEGDLKLYHESLKLVNPLRQLDQAKSILGFESKTSMEDTYKTIQNLDRL